MWTPPQYFAASKFTQPFTDDKETDKERIALNLLIYVDGYLRVGGKDRETNISYNQKRPIFVAGKSKFKEFPAQGYRQKLAHFKKQAHGPYMGLQMRKNFVIKCY